MVHFYSLPSKNADHLAFFAMNQYICKASKLLGMEKNVSKWKFVSLHDFGLKNQTDDASCG